MVQTDVQDFKFGYLVQLSLKEYVMISLPLSGFWVHLKDGDSGSKLHEIKMRGVKTIICKFMCQTRIEILHISNC